MKQELIHDFDYRILGPLKHTTVKAKTYTTGEVILMFINLQYDLYHALCHEIHGKEDCPCTNQSTSCSVTFRVCDVNRAIRKVIQEKINVLRGEIG